MLTKVPEDLASEWTMKGVLPLARGQRTKKGNVLCSFGSLAIALAFTVLFVVGWFTLDYLQQRWSAPIEAALQATTADLLKETKKKDSLQVQMASLNQEVSQARSQIDLLEKELETLRQDLELSRSAEIASRLRSEEIEFQLESFRTESDRQLQKERSQAKWMEQEYSRIKAEKEQCSREKGSKISSLQQQANQCERELNQRLNEHQKKLESITDQHFFDGWKKILLLPQAPLKKEAYVTLITTEQYVQGALVWASSLLHSGTQRDILLLAMGDRAWMRKLDATVEKFKGMWERKAGKGAQIVFREVQKVQLPRRVLQTTHFPSYRQSEFTKFRIWEQTDYEKLVYMDADCITTRNVDELFWYPELSSAVDLVIYASNLGQGKSQAIANSGVMVVEPNVQTMQNLIDLLRSGEELEDNNGDQGVIFGYFVRNLTKWSPLPFYYNYFSRVLDGEWADVDKVGEGSWGRHEEDQAASAPYLPLPGVIHYVGIKPWDTMYADEKKWTRTTRIWAEAYQVLKEEGVLG